MWIFVTILNMMGLLLVLGKYQLFYCNVLLIESRRLFLLGYVRP